MTLATLKIRMADIAGIDQLSMELLAGRQNYSLNGRLISVDAAASDADAEHAIRASLASNAIAQLPAGTPAGIPAVSSASLLPAVNPQPAQESKTMTSPAPGSFAASLKAMMDEAQAGVEQARAAGRARVGAAISKLNDVKASTTKVSTGMAEQIEDAANAALADLGQISNNL